MNFAYPPIAAPTLNQNTLKRFYLTLCALTCLIITNTQADILGMYYDQNNTSRQYFTGTEFNITDSNINFNWGSSAPFAGLGSNDFSVRWVGEVEAPASGD